MKIVVKQFELLKSTINYLLDGVQEATTLQHQLRTTTVLRYDQFLTIIL